MLYISTGIWMHIFNIFNGKKLKKGEKSQKFAAKFSKKIVFLSLHQNTGQVFYSQKKTAQQLKNDPKL